MQLSLQGKVAFITGSTRGIGWETARALASAGASVLLNGSASQEALDERVETIRTEFNVPCRGYLANSADSTAVKACYAEIFREFRGLDILVNNAGILRSGLLGMIPDTVIHEVLGTNVAGCLYHLQEASRLMARRKSGSIINMTSIFGLRGDPGHAVYSASKAAVVGMTLAAAKELGPKGIRVNAVAPGFILTDMTGSLSVEQLGQRVSSISLRRVGKPEDVAKAVLFLASDLAAYVSGQVLGVDGAMTL